MERAVAAQLQREMKWNTSTDRDLKFPYDLTINTNKQT